MINQPPVDLLIEQLGTDKQPVSRYCLCVVAAKRARQIIEQNFFKENSKNILTPVPQNFMCRNLAQILTQVRGS